MSPSATVRRCRTPRSFERTFPGSRLCNKRHSTGYEGAARCKHRFTRKDTFLKSLSEREELISIGGITVNNALIPKAKRSQIGLNYDTKGNLFGLYSYSLSNILQLEVLNIGSFGSYPHKRSEVINRTYLSKNNRNFRVGSKLLVLSPQKDDPFWMSLRATFGRNDSTNQGYIFGELINTFKINNYIALNLSPRYFISGVRSFAGIGASTYLTLFDNLQLIPELNASFNDDSDINYTIALRYGYQRGKSVDFYYSNAVGIQDIGQMLKDKEYKFGIKLNFIY